jgi:8-oxo-dGTP pyrophosphatase MutT (NUDIX family)
MIPKFNNTENKCITVQETGEKAFLSRSLAVCILVGHIDITGEPRVLVVKRGEKVTHSGLYCLPCGYLDYDETLSEAAKREVYEETGIIIENPKFVNIVDTPTEFRQNVTVNYSQLFSDSPMMSDLADKAHLDDLIEQLTPQLGESDVVTFLTEDEVMKLDFAFNHKVKIATFFNNINEMFKRLSFLAQVND